MTKYLIHKITGKTELERICLASYDLSAKTKKIEICLHESNNDYLKSLVKSNQVLNDNEQSDIVCKIIQIKHIPLYDSKLNSILKHSLQRISFYNNLLHQVETLRKTPFQFQNNEHKELILGLWNSLTDNEELNTLISNKWLRIGFQSNDPSTDFRGMGLLGLINLNYFTNNAQFKDISKNVFSKSNHPKFGYSFSIVGINITSWVHKWLSDGSLKNYFYNSSIDFHDNQLTIDQFNYIYSVIFCEFDRFWHTVETSMINFESYTKTFRKFVLKRLEEPDVDIKLNFIETIDKSKCCF